MGGGRRRAEDEIDHSVGLSELPELGQKVEANEPLCFIHARNVDEANMAARRIIAAVTVSDEPSGGQPVVYEVIDFQG